MRIRLDSNRFAFLAYTRACYIMHIALCELHCISWNNRSGSIGSCQNGISDYWESSRIRENLVFARLPAVLVFFFLFFFFVFRDFFYLIPGESLFFPSFFIHVPFPFEFILFPFRFLSLFQYSIHAE